MERLPDPRSFVRMFIRYESARSSEIENIDTNVDDLLNFEVELALENDPEKAPDEIFDRSSAESLREVENHIEASYRAYNQLEDIPFSKRLLKEIHELLMRGDVRGHNQNPGSFRDVQNYIGNANRDEVWHIPPPPNYVEECLDNLEKFIHDRSDDAYPPLVKAGMAHVQFEAIHPFLDGNGRVGRLMVPLILRQESILDHPVFYLSSYFKQNEDRYYNLINETQHNGTWEEWLEFFMKGMEESSENVRETVNNAVDLHDDLLEHYRNEYQLTDNVRAAIEFIYGQPKFTIKQLKQSIGVSHPTANTFVERFSELGYVEDVTDRKRGSVYSFEPYMEIFRQIEQGQDQSPESIHVSMDQ
jgi:Fic family protein